MRHDHYSPASAALCRLAQRAHVLGDGPARGVGSAPLRPRQLVQQRQLGLGIGIGISPVLGGGVQAAPSSPLSTRAGLVSLWRFESLLADTVGSSTLTNNNVATQGTGKVGSGLVLVSGSNQFMTVASNATLQAGAGDFWLACWVKLATVATCNVIGKQSTISTSGTLEYSFQYSGTSWRFRGSFGSGGTVSAISGVAAVQDAWTFGFCWFNRTIGRVYIRIDHGTIANGPLANMWSSTEPLIIGASATGANNLNGEVDECAIGKVASGALGDGTNGTLANEISETLYAGGSGLAWPW